MFDLVDARGEPFFTCMNVGLLCQKCVKAGKSSCEHVIMADTKPPWQSDLKHDLVAALYRGREDLHKAEIMGAVVDNNTQAFKAADVTNFMARTLAVQPRDVRRVLTGLDPNGGGAGSEAALITVALLRNQLCVLAVSSRAVRGYDAISELVCGHLTAVARTYPRATNVLACENNLGNESSWTAALVRRKNIARVLIAYEKPQLPGVRTTNDKKKLFVGELQRFFATNAAGFGNGCTWGADASREKLEEQLKAYRRTTRTNKLGNITESYGGKQNGCDDLALCMGLSAYWLLQAEQGLLNAT